MYSIDKLTLISGIDIPIPELQVNIHQPTIKEIAYIGEKSFYTAANTLCIDKNMYINTLQGLEKEEIERLKQKSSFEIFLLIINFKENAMLKLNVISLFSLLFPTMSITIEERFIILVDAKEKRNIILNDETFEILQQIITTILCLHSGTGQDDFNPQGDRARAIAEKIKMGRAKAAMLKGENNNNNASFLSKYISGLGIGTNSLTIRDTLELTLYQLLNQIQRYGLYAQYDISIRAKMAGASDVEEVDWLKDIENN